MFILYFPHCTRCSDNSLQNQTSVTTLKDLSVAVERVVSLAGNNRKNENRESIITLQRNRNISLIEQPERQAVEGTFQAIKHFYLRPHPVMNRSSQDCSENGSATPVSCWVAISSWFHSMQVMHHWVSWYVFQLRNRCREKTQAIMKKSNCEIHVPFDQETAFSRPKIIWNNHDRNLLCPCFSMFFIAHHRVAPFIALPMVRFLIGRLIIFLLYASKLRMSWVFRDLAWPQVWNNIYFCVFISKRCSELTILKQQTVLGETPLRQWRALHKC